MEILLSWPGGDWQTTLRLVGAVVAGYFLLLWATYILWVARDIRLRTHDPVSQIIAILIAIILPFITFPIYITLRPRDTLQDSYLKLLEREVLFSQLEEIQNNSQTFPVDDLNSSENTLLVEMNDHEFIESSEPILFFDDVDEIEFDEFDSQDEFSLTYSEDEIINDDTEELPLEDEIINDDTKESPLEDEIINDDTEESPLEDEIINDDTEEPPLEDEIINADTEKSPQKLSFDEVEEVNFAIDNKDPEKT